MNRKETLELLIKIQEAIEQFEGRIMQCEWSNTLGMGLEIPEIRDKNEQNIIIYGMCIGRLNERFTKQLNALK